MTLQKYNQDIHKRHGLLPSINPSEYKTIFQALSRRVILLGSNESSLSNVILLLIGETASCACNVSSVEEKIFGFEVFHEITFPELTLEIQRRSTNLIHFVETGWSICRNSSLKDRVGEKLDLKCHQETLLLLEISRRLLRNSGKSWFQNRPSCN